MSTGTRVDRHTASLIANELVTQLQTATYRIEVAGSIRRGKPDVGDIELVAVPIKEVEPDGMFDSTEVNRLTERIEQLIYSGRLASHPTDPKRGERYSKLIEPASGLQVDLFSATAETFGIIYLIRTGPADYSHRFVTDLRRRALHVKNGELHRGSLGCGSSPCEVVDTPSELEVFDAAGWPFVKPELRA